MNRRTRKALGVMFGDLYPVELRDHPIATFYPSERVIQQLIAGIECVQAGSGDPSPDNIRPILGWTGMSLFLEHAYDISASPVLSVSWLGDAGTVYGGTLDVVAGILTVTHAIADLGDGSWTLNNTSQFMYSSLIASTVKKPPNDTTVANAICSIARAVSADYLYDAAITGAAFGVVSSNGNIRLRYDNFPTDPNQFRAAVAGQKIVYELATPIAYALTPNQILTLTGKNVLWCDTGNIIELIA